MILLFPGDLNIRSRGGATAVRSSYRHRTSNFNPCPPQGSDHIFRLDRGGCFVFQSTLPRGSDPREGRVCWYTYDFNPRSREGATHLTAAFSAAHRFQSTLPQGSDGDFSSLYSIHPHFNPRSRKGATFHGIRDSGSFRISIHAPARERP